jgi:alpha-1,6-mannosyltransferase
MYSELRDKSKKLPVTFLGYIADRERLAEILASADVSLAPGPIETFCLAALESLAAGTPVVASKTSAVGEFLLLNTSQPVGAVAGNTGYEFATAIEQVLELRKDSTLSQRCFHQAENFPWSATLSLMLKLHGESNLLKRKLRAA